MTDRRLIGAAGEYHVAAELSRRDWLATVTIKNAPGTDVLAQHHETGRVIAIQTKTASRHGQAFRLSAKDERMTEADNEWYAFVGLRGEDERPTFYLVPRNVVAEMLRADHRRWMSRPGRTGLPHVDSPIRAIRPGTIAAWAERWDLLTKPADMPSAGVAPTNGR